MTRAGPDSATEGGAAASEADSGDKDDPMKSLLESMKREQEKK